MVSANVEIHHQGVVRRKEFTVDQSFSWASLVDKIVSKFKLKEKPTLLQYTFEGQSYDVEDDEDLEVLVNRKTDEKLVLIHRVADDPVPNQTSVAGSSSAPQTAPPIVQIPTLPDGLRLAPPPSLVTYSAPVNVAALKSLLAHPEISPETGLPVATSASTLAKAAKGRRLKTLLEGDRQEFLETVARLAAEVETFLDPANQTSTASERRRLRLRLNYEEFVQGLYKESNAAELDPMHYWHADVIKKHVFMFMSWLVERTPGKFDQFVLAATLTQWLHDMALNIGSHCFMLVPEVGDNGPEFKVVWCGLEVLSTGGLYPRLRQLVEAITDAKHLLKSSPRPKFYIGLEEHVFIQQTSLHSIPTARDPRIPLQRLSIGLIEFVQGSRPSSLAARAGTKAREKGEFAKLRHFTIRRTDEPASFEVTFKVTELKGYFSSARKAHDDTLYKPTSHPSSILIDPIAIVLDFFYRGALCVEDLDDLLFGDQAVIDIKSEFLDTPLFCAIGPKGAALVNPIAPGTSQAWGAQVVQLTKTALGVPITAYGYRREFVDRLIAAFDNETAATFANHATPYKTATRHYSRSKVNVDLVAVAAMEGSVSPRTLMRGKMLRFTGIALEFHARKQALKREIPKNRATNTVVDNDGDDASDADAAPKSSRGRGSAKASIVVTAEELEAELEDSVKLKACKETLDDAWESFLAVLPEWKRNPKFKRGRRSRPKPGPYTSKGSVTTMMTSYEHCMPSDPDELQTITTKRAEVDTAIDAFQKAEGTEKRQARSRVRTRKQNELNAVKYTVADRKAAAKALDEGPEVLQTLQPIASRRGDPPRTSTSSHPVLVSFDPLAATSATPTIPPASLAPPRSLAPSEQLPSDSIRPTWGADDHDLHILGGAEEETGSADDEQESEEEERDVLSRNRTYVKKKNLDVVLSALERLPRLPADAPLPFAIKTVAPRRRVDDSDDESSGEDEDEDRHERFREPLNVNDAPFVVGEQVGESMVNIQMDAFETRIACARMIDRMVGEANSLSRPTKRIFGAAHGLEFPVPGLKMPDAGAFCLGPGCCEESKEIDGVVYNGKWFMNQPKLIAHMKTRHTPFSEMEAEWAKNQPTECPICGREPEVSRKGKEKMAMRNHALNYCPAIIWWWGQGPKDVGKFTTHPLAGDWSEETIVEALRPLSNIHFEIPDGYLDSEELEALSELTTSFSIRPPKDKDDFDMLPETVHPVPPPSKELLALIGK